VRGRDSLRSGRTAFQNKDNFTADCHGSNADWHERIRVIFVLIRGKPFFCCFFEGQEKASARTALAFLFCGLQPRILSYFPVGQTTPWLPRFTCPMPL
jgi:hypothetical protein